VFTSSLADAREAVEPHAIRAASGSGEQLVASHLQRVAAEPGDRGSKGEP
jgi:hypothetical protein